jgi:hypothetical protein
VSVPEAESIEIVPTVPLPVAEIDQCVESFHESVPDTVSPPETLIVPDPVTLLGVVVLDVEELVLSARFVTVMVGDTANWSTITDAEPSDETLIEPVYGVPPEDVPLRVNEPVTVPLESAIVPEIVLKVNGAVALTPVAVIDQFLLSLHVSVTVASTPPTTTSAVPVTVELSDLVTASVVTRILDVIARFESVIEAVPPVLNVAEPMNAVPPADVPPSVSAPLTAPDVELTFPEIVVRLVLPIEPEPSAVNDQLDLLLTVPVTAAWSPPDTRVADTAAGLLVLTVTFASLKVTVPIWNVGIDAVPDQPEEFPVRVTVTGADVPIPYPARLSVPLIVPPESAIVPLSWLRSIGALELADPPEIVNVQLFASV